MARTPGELDITESMRQGLRIHAQPKQCWWNALRALRTDKALAQCCYVEGLMVYTDMPALTFQHGWLERPDGSVIDPTAVMLHDGGVAEGTVGVRYYPVARYTRAEARLFHRRNSMPVTHPYRNTDWRRAEYTALLAALGPTPGAEQVTMLRDIYQMDDLERHEAAQAAQAESEKGA